MTDNNQPNANFDNLNLKGALFHVTKLLWRATVPQDEQRGAYETTLAKAGHRDLAERLVEKLNRHRVLGVTLSGDSKATHITVPYAEALRFANHHKQNSAQVGGR
jgi:hypothetical protein